VYVSCNEFVKLMSLKDGKAIRDVSKLGYDEQDE